MGTRSYTMKKSLFWGLVLLSLSIPSACDLPPEDEGNGNGSIDYSGYEALFSKKTLHEVEIVISQEEWDGHIQDMKDYAEKDPMELGRTGKYRKATFVYRGPAGDRTIRQVGFRTKGNASRTIPQEINDVTGEHGALHRAHFKVKFNEPFNLPVGTDAYQQRDDRRFCQLRKLDFRMNSFDPPWWDESQVREIYSFDLLTRAGVTAPRTGSAKLYITIEGIRNYFGIYTIVEPVDKSFLTKRFGRDGNDGNLYKCLFGDSGPATLEPIEDVPELMFPERRVIGSKDWKTNYRPTYDLKTNEEAADHTVLLDFIHKLNTLNGRELKFYLDHNFRVKDFLMAQAINVLLGKWDDYWPMGNNYYLYFNNQGKIEFIPVDYDMVFGQAIPLIDTDTVGIYAWPNIVNQFISIQTGYPVFFLNLIHKWGSPLVTKILAIPEYREIYEQYIVDLITPANELFVYSDYAKTYKKMAALYAGHLDNDVDEAEVMKNAARVREYFYTRTRAVIDELGLDETAFETRVTSLDPPFGVSASRDVSFRYIAVTWDSEVYGDSFSVFRSDSEDGSYERVGEGITEYLFQDDTVEPATVYYYKVKACMNDGLESDFSSPVSGSTSSAEVLAPSGVTASDGVFNDTVLVLWEVSANADYYRVYRSEAVAGPYNLVSGDLHGTAFYDLLASTGVSYRYRVKAYNETEGESDFSEEAVGSASAAGADGPEFTQGDPLVSGTYRSTDELLGTYTFDAGGSCTKTMLAIEDPGLDYYDLAGTWRYEEPDLIIETNAEYPWYDIAMTETYPNSFTTHDGERLYLVGARQVKPDEGEFLKFVGTGLNRIVIGGGFLRDEILMPIEVTIIVNEDGSGNATLAIGDEEPVTESWPAAPYTFELIEFHGAYYMPMEVDGLHIRQ
jgi:spore coat protein CotH